MFIDPIIISWALIAGASICAFMVGLLWGERKTEETINNTILYLIENNFVKARKINGEWEILNLDGEAPDLDQN